MLIDRAERALVVSAAAVVALLFAACTESRWLVASDCEANGVCPDGYVCVDHVCVPGPDASTCGEQICHAAASCDESGAAPSCSCPRGYEGDGLEAGTGCENVDECADGSHDCVPEIGLCTDTEGGWECGCLAGYDGDGRVEGTGCENVDECAEGSDDCVPDISLCTDTEGGWACACLPGYEGDGRRGGTGCVDVDECADGSHDCVPDISLCTDTAGGWECECPSGYEGDGREDGTGCVNVDECAEGSHDCVLEGGLCADTEGSWTCSCAPGFEGDGRVGGTGCAAIVESGCASGVEHQSFAEHLVGCAGAVSFAFRDSLCADGWTTCDAQAWRELLADGGAAPTHHYWTDDDLLWVEGGSSGSCEVTTDAGYEGAISTCSPSQPMRVCAPLGDPAGSAGGHIDPSGNDCNWINCGFEATSPNAYFGGCEGNGTAGALCCAPPHCADGTAEQVFGPGVVGCGGSVVFAFRASLCAPGWRVCTAAEWRDALAASGVAPTHHYWTDDDIYWVGGGGPGSCEVTLSPFYPYASDSCSPHNPMRVCADVGDPSSYGGHFDPEGNDCNWTGCGFEATSPNEHFGGCIGNATAGALCCL